MFQKESGLPKFVNALEEPWQVSLNIIEIYRYSFKVVGNNWKTRETRVVTNIIR